jgi:lipopolysaccharide export system protein LptA
MKRQLVLWGVMAALAAPGLAAAQGPNSAAKPPSLIHGAEENKDRDKPIQIESATLEVRDKTKVATFLGNVVVVQGDTTLKCQKLVVFYGPEEGAAGAAGTAKQAPEKPAPETTASTARTPGSALPQDSHDIRRLEAYTDVTVTTKDQNASGDSGIYDVKTKTITLIGHAVVSQGQDVVRGDRIVVDTITGYSRVEADVSGAGPSRVRALLVPNKGANGGEVHVMSAGQKN